MGQLSGPLLAALSSHFSGNLQLALVVAGCGLLIGASLLWQQCQTAQRCPASS
ncbi:MAG: MFS transporter [Pseudomonas sp.]|nr:MFS transporter [Pseudomonas sp.]